MRYFRNRRKFSVEQYYEATGFTLEEAGKILEKIGPTIQRPTARSRSLTPHQLLFLALRALKTGDDLSSVGYSLGVSRSTAGRAVKEVSAAIIEHMHENISLRGTELEWRQLSQIIWDKYRLPNVCGALDGTIVKVFNENDANFLWTRISDFFR
uniref:Transposase n=1 Tax=Panagrolaimus superbus TaxID=310955 RepID=A0A914YMN9_9BILA